MNRILIADHAPAESSHAGVVDAWVRRAIENDPSADALELFHVVFETVWNRAVATLGTTTLLAITERVLRTASNRYRFLLAINTRPTTDPRWRQRLYARLGAVPRLQLIEGLRFALIELLTVIGRLTAEILSDELHAAVIDTATGEPERAIAIAPAAPRRADREHA